MPVTQPAREDAAHWTRSARPLALLFATLMVAVSTVFVASPAHAAPTPIDGITYETDDATQTATATDFDDGWSSDPVIPATILVGTSPYQVTTIGDDAFREKFLTSVSIPGSVTTIGNYAFANNELTTVAIPNSVITIGEGAFAENWLETATIGDAVTVIEQSAFSHNFLTSITIPNSVTTVGNAAFVRNELTSLTLGDNVATIGVNAFQENQLTGLTIPDSVTTIGHNAFWLNDLATVAFGNSVSTIGHYAFAINELVDVTLPDSVTTVGDGAFSGNALTSLSLGSSVATIGEGAFLNNNLTTVVIPRSVTSIGDAAFLNNAALSSVVLQGPPPTVTALGSTSGSFGLGVLVYYPSQFAGLYDPSRSSTWEDYAAVPGATLSFDLGGRGEAVSSVTVVPGATPPTSLVPPTEPAAAGYAFGGWFTTATGGTAFDFAAPLAADATAFARWTGGPPSAAPATLPVMGADLAPMGTVGAGLLLLGALVLAWTRRRRHSTSPN